MPSQYAVYMICGVGGFLERITSRTLGIVCNRDASVAELLSFSGDSYY